MTPNQWKIHKLTIVLSPSRDLFNKETLNVKSFYFTTIQDIYKSSSTRNKNNFRNYNLKYRVFQLMFSFWFIRKTRVFCEKSFNFGEIFVVNFNNFNARCSSVYRSLLINGIGFSCHLSKRGLLGGKVEFMTVFTNGAALRQL